MTSQSPKITPQFILNAYAQGYFPMGEPGSDEILWYSPDPRGIIPLDTFKSKKSLRNIINRNIYDVRFNTCFIDVMKGCSDRTETWITNDIISWYDELHLMGFAHSVEVFEDNELVGGLYGIAIRGAFFGESMFSRVPNASKIALHFLVEHLRKHDYVLLDTQFMNDHIRSLGGVNIPKKEYLNRLKDALEIDTHF